MWYRYHKRGGIVTIKKIAALAGVSTSTVSRVLNSSGYVKDEVREKIEKVIRDTGYVPSSVAKDLKRKDTDFIGVIIPKINSSSIGDLVSGIEEILSENNLQMLLATTNNSNEKELDYLNLFREKRVKGILLLGTEITEKHKDIFREIKTPLVIIGQREKNLKRSSVIQKDREAVRELTKTVIKNGHRDIGYVGVESWDRAVGSERKEGYLEGLKDFNIPLDNGKIYLGDFSDATPEEGSKKLIEAGVTAIIAATDTFAIKIIYNLRKLGKKVPEEISVLGVGNSEIGKLFFPSLTTVDYDYVETGKKATQLLLKKISGEVSIEHIEMDYKIIIRESLKKFKK